MRLALALLRDALSFVIAFFSCALVCSSVCFLEEQVACLVVLAAAAARLRYGDVVVCGV